MSALDRGVQKRLAVGVFAGLEGESPDAVRLLSRALGMADGPLSQFSLAFDYWADALEIPDSDGGLAVLKMAYDLRHVTTFHPDLPALLERLDGSDGVLWQRLAGALREIWITHELQNLDAIPGEHGAEGDAKC